MRTGTALCALGAMMMTCAAAFAQGPAVDVTTLGPQVGQTIADFRLTDQNGRTWTRDSLMGPNGLMLVFSRSADWCPYCKTQLAELQTRVPEIRRKGWGLAAITYDSTAILANFAKRRGITFTLLSDPGSATIRTYGILNTTVDPKATQFGIPFPGTFIVNRRGVVTARFFEQAYQERNTVASILLKLGEPGHEVAGEKLTTDQVTITAYASDPVVAPGTLFSVVAEIVPRPGMHVYAPGRHDYKVVTLTLDPQPFLKTRPVRYPPSEIYEFKPLNERVEVYQKPFRLVADLSFEATPESRQALAARDGADITGRIEYQACDATMCYLAKTVPVKFHVALRTLDLERAAVSK